MSAAASFNSRTILGINQEAYQQLHLTAGLNLRRQLFFAVCDDSVLQRQLAYQLDINYAEQSDSPDSQATIVTFWIDPQSPSLLRPILDWLKQHRLGGISREVPLFQVLGIDQLTQQSPGIQNQFLLSLARLELLLTRVDVSLLLWLPRPWLHKLRRGAPSFWRLRSRLFEFAGEPTLIDETGGADRLWIRSVGGLNRPESSPKADSENPLASLWSMLAEMGSQPDDGTMPLSLPVPLHFEATERVAAPPAQSQVPKSQPPAFQNYPRLAAQLQQIQALEAQQAGPLTLAQMYLGLGQLCRDRIEAGDSTQELLDLAISAYTQALAALPPNSGDRCDSLNDLGSLYWLRSQTETRAEATAAWLVQSLDAYRQALQLPKSLIGPDAIARISSNLGAACGLLAGLQNPVENLKLAVEAYRQALEVRPANTYELEYASLQNSLGSTYWQLSQLESAPQYLHQAIRAYSEALQHRSAAASRADFAMLQNNLGIAYWNLAQYEQPGFLLEQAVQAYQAALTIRTVAADPAGCAATQNNLGTAYWDLAQHHGQQPDQQLAYWQQSVAAYEASLGAAQQAQGLGLTLSFEVWATFHSAGVVHDHIALRLPETAAESRSHHLQRALELYIQALEGWRDDPDRLRLLKDGLAHNVRSHYEILGMAGQQQALSQVPPELLSAILAQV